MSRAIDNGEPLPDLILQNASGIAVGELAPRSDWGGMRELEHFVQFYETDKFLLDSLAGFIGTGLEKGDAGIVVATEAHREALEERLEARGIDLAAARVAAQYVSIDAQELLSKLLVDGSPDRGLFTEIIGGIIDRAARGGRRVRAFGEMVALLWSEGKQEDALRLEELWNELHKTRSFSLLCGYPMSGFCEEIFTEPLHHVCTAHSRVIPAESYSGIEEADARLRAIIELQQKARLLEAEIVERKETERALRSVKEELERLLVSEQILRVEAESANRLKDEFLATVSHELRTPLTAILGWAHILRENRPDTDAAERAMKTIERNAQLLAQLVEDILDVSRVITGNLRLSVSRVDAASVINAAIDSVQLAADAKSIRLEITQDPKARRIQADASRLQQVVWNLLSNAIKFTPTGGRVFVRLERTKDFVQIKVSDTGVGISPDFLPHVFDRFRQADGSSTRRHGGLGLGLAIVRHLVELHGGTVCAESAGEGQGSTFVISLPLSTSYGQGRVDGGGVAEPSLPNASMKARPLSSLPSLEGVKVLAVDDDRDTLGLLAVILSEYKATVQTASSTDEALEVLEWYAPDVLISDIAMPGEDGYSLINKIRECEAQTGGKPVQAIALTAYARVEDRARALSGGFNLFVPKPVEPSELVTAIAALVALS